jgi:hypothetical protein
MISAFKPLSSRVCFRNTRYNLFTCNVYKDEPAMLISDTWDDCVKRYEYLKQSEHWTALASAMLRLIEKIQQDRTFPPTVHIVSHAWLRIGPVIEDESYRPGVWIGWRKPNYYWIGIGSFGTQRRITVSADKALPMLKRYLKLLPKIDPEFAQYVPPDEWTRDALETKYARLPAGEVMPVLAEDVAGQVADVRELADQLRDILNRLEQMDEAQHTLDELLKRADRISDLISTGLQRVQPAPSPQPAPEPELSMMNGHKM